jgi:AraC-like DNA-binding protein
MANQLPFIMVFFSIGLLGLVVSSVLVFVNHERPLVSNLLAAVIATLSVLVIVNVGYLTDFFLKHPILWRPFSWLSFCTAPLSYLYVRSVLRQSIRLQRSDLLFFLPALLYALHRLPFHFLSREEKLEVVKRGLSDMRLIVSEPEGLLPEGWASLLRVFIGIGFMLAQTWILVQWIRKHRDRGEGHPVNRQILNWLVVFTILVAASFVMVWVQTMLLVFAGIATNYVIVSTMAFFILFISAYLLAQPRILYGFSGWLPSQGPPVELSAVLAEPSVVDAEEGVTGEPHARTSLSVERALEIKGTVEEHLKSKQPYRKPRYSLNEMAMELSIPSYQLSAFVNQAYGMNFNEFVNAERIRHIQDRLSREPELRKYTLEALSKEAGFNSRGSFIKAVKRLTGKTPSELFSVDEG